MVQPICQRLLAPTVFKAMVDGHGRSPGTYFQGWALLRPMQSDGIHCGGQLILKKISKICATRCQILRQKYTKSDFRWAPARPHPTEELTALYRPDPLAYLRVLLLRAGKGRSVAFFSPYVYCNTTFYFRSKICQILGGFDGIAHCVWTKVAESRIHPVC